MSVVKAVHMGVPLLSNSMVYNVDTVMKGRANHVRRLPGFTVPSEHHYHHHLPLNCEGRWGTTDDFITSFLHFPLFSTALWDSRPVHS